MVLSIVVGVAAPYTAGPSAWHAEGLFPNGDQVRVHGNAWTSDKGQLVLIAITKLLQRARISGRCVIELVVTAFESDVKTLFERGTEQLNVGKGRTGRSFLKHIERIQLRWDLRPEPGLRTQQIA